MVEPFTGPASAKQASSPGDFITGKLCHTSWAKADRDTCTRSWSAVAVFEDLGLTACAPMRDIWKLQSKTFKMSVSRRWAQLW
jgi:hypothetical protein